MPSLLYPPTPKGKINPNTVGNYEIRRNAGKWIAQRKFNGTHITVRIPVNRKIHVLTKHGEEPKQWSLDDDVAAQLASLNYKQGQEYWLDGELFNNKTKTPYYKNRIVLYDLLYAGQSLYLGPTCVERVQMLSTICGDPQELEPHFGLALRVTENVWMAETFTSDFKARYADHLDKPEIEGLVLKRRNSQLDDTGTKEWEVDWMTRCRKPHKNYSC